MVCSYYAMVIFLNLVTNDTLTVIRPGIVFYEEKGTDARQGKITFRPI